MMVTSNIMIMMIIALALVIKLSMLCYWLPRIKMIAMRMMTIIMMMMITAIVIELHKIIDDNDVGKQAAIAILGVI